MGGGHDGLRRRAPRPEVRSRGAGNCPRVAPLCPSGHASGPAVTRARDAGASLLILERTIVVTSPSVASSDQLRKAKPLAISLGDVAVPLVSCRLTAARHTWLPTKKRAPPVPPPTPSGTGCRAVPTHPCGARPVAVRTGSRCRAARSGCPPAPNRGARRGSSRALPQRKTCARASCPVEERRSDASLQETASTDSHSVRASVPNRPSTDATSVQHLFGCTYPDPEFPKGNGRICREEPR